VSELKRLEKKLTIELLSVSSIDPDSSITIKISAFELHEGEGQEVPEGILKVEFAPFQAECPVIS